jgi:thiamine-monophosphate kinase
MTLSRWRPYDWTGSCRPNQTPKWDAAVQEFELIAAIRRAAGSDPRVPLGIGDDAAVIQTAAGGQIVVAVDTLMEGVHFTFPEDDRDTDREAGFPHATPELAGRKALAVNLSDLAAMAARPLAAVVGAAFPRRRGAEFARRVMDGCIALAQEFDVALVGGDTNTWDGPLMLSVTVLGEPTPRGVVRRDGARVGDWILVTGELGGSGRRRHLEFTPRVREALALHESVPLHAMIDISDGLASDLHHILDESGVGAVIHGGQIPISAATAMADDGHAPLDHALNDGEDFELLFTVAPADGRKLLEDRLAGVPRPLSLSRIGEIVAVGTREIIRPDGSHTPLPRGGWQHRF